jgi:hypothetical protein
MTQIRVTQYTESWQGKSVLGMHPGVYPDGFLRRMFGEEFVDERLNDGTFVAIGQGETIEA